MLFRGGSFGGGGRGGGWGGGYGFGFRGTSPPWPYIGRGRGGLPRCWRYGAFMAPAYSPGSVPYPAYGDTWSPPLPGGFPSPGPVPYAPRMTGERELDFLRETTEAIKRQMEEIEARINELEAREG